MVPLHRNRKVTMTGSEGHCCCRLLASSSSQVPKRSSWQQFCVLSASQCPCAKGMSTEEHTGELETVFTVLRASSLLLGTSHWGCPSHCPSEPWMIEEAAMDAFLPMVSLAECQHNSPYLVPDTLQLWAPSGSLHRSCPDCLASSSVPMGS